MRTESAFVGARGYDSYPFSSTGSAQQAIDLKKSGMDFGVFYLGTIDNRRLGYVLDAGLAAMFVTIACQYNGKTTVSQCRGLGLPAGCTIYLDVEGRPAWDTPAPVLMQSINGWANDVAAAGYQPGGYFGSPQPLNSNELYALRLVRYWKSMSRISDKTGSLAEPSCGWSMYQMNPSVHWAGTYIDVNIVCEDYKHRLPNWVVGDEAIIKAA